VGRHLASGRAPSLPVGHELSDAQTTAPTPLPPCTIRLVEVDGKGPQESSGMPTPRGRPFAGGRLALAAFHI
jgi:hypothetical protein